MGQQYRNFYGQPYNGMPVSAATASTISNLQQSLAGTLSPAGIPGVDPAQMAAAQQSLANPNAGDTAALGGPNSFLPGPKELALGAVAGVGTWAAFTQAAEKNVFNRGAEWIDKMTFGPKLAAKFDPKLREWGQRSPFINEFMLSEAHIDPTTWKHLSETEREARILETKRLAVDNMQHRHLTVETGNFQNRFAKAKPQNDAIKATYRSLLTEMDGAHSTHTAHNFMEHSIPQEGAEKMTIRGSVPGAVKSPSKFYSQEFGALEDLKRQHKFLNDKPKLTKVEKQTRKALYQLMNRLDGINSRHTPLYESQAEMTARLSAKGVGPVGRGLASFSHYLQRVFNLSAMSGGTSFVKKMTATAAGGKFGWGPAAMAALMGVVVFGCSFQSARKAKDGEKNKTFFHNLFGTGIASLIGWEFGRKLLESTHKAGKIFGIRNPFGFGFLKKIPVLKYVAGWSMAGIGTELLAMFGIGYVVQKVGEKVAHAIFGKPSKESIDGKGQDGKGNASALKNQMPQNAMAKTPTSTIPNTATDSAAHYAPGNLQARSPNKFSISPADIRYNPQLDLQTKAPQQFPPDAAKKWTEPPSSLLSDLDNPHKNASNQMSG